MSHDEANKVALAALQSRVEDLPDAQVQTAQLGKQIQLMQPRFQALLDHPAGPMLEDWAAKGCPVDCGPNWPLEKLEAALAYGSHPSAKIPEARKCLLDETKDKVDKGFARVLKWKDIKHALPPNLKLSPVAMIPHKSRAFRCILDLSFNLKLKDKHQHTASVNQTTEKLAPAAAMAQLGVTLRRIIHTMEKARQKGTSLLFSKLDIKDGFWRLMVSDHDAWNFCYMIPPASTGAPLDEVDVVIPNCLQMGWCESPPFFCAASETARDVIASSLLGTNLPPHPFESHMLPKDSIALPIQDLTSTISLLEVFVDDFIAVTDNTSRDHLENFSRAMLHGIHTVFPPPSFTGHHVGGDPISEKKLKKLEGLWEQVKEVLGWMLDGANYTIELPEAKVT